MANRVVAQALALVCIVTSNYVRADEAGWTVLIDAQGLHGWKAPSELWQPAKAVSLDSEKPRQLKIEPGTGIYVNAQKGRTKNLITSKDYGDLEAHVEFCIPKGSNSGVKFGAVYEIQIYDSYGKSGKLTGSDCGGIYPRAEGKPKYHHIDEGTAPRVNACRAPGEWQTLDMIFLAPRFDADGKKIASACMVKVVLNGQLIHDNVEVKTPTGSNWVLPEKPAGPFLLQADHGPIAFRNVRIRPFTK